LVTLKKYSPVRCRFSVIYLINKKIKSFFPVTRTKKRARRVLAIALKNESSRSSDLLNSDVYGRRDAGISSLEGEFTIELT